MSKYKPSKRWARLFLPAVEELIRQYTKYREKTSRCPLCVVDELYVDCCFRCPWMMFENKSCTDAEYEEHPIKDRLTRLRRWKRKMKEILK